MSLKLKLYNAIVNRVPVIKLGYESYVLQNSGSKAMPIKKAARLFVLYIRYYVLRDKKLSVNKNVKVYEGSESGKTDLDSPMTLAEKLAQYDVISFDIFDTLIFRPFANPDDLFYVIGEKLDYPNFRQVRSDAEKAARQLLFKQCGSYEITLEDIYQVLENTAGIDKETGIAAEMKSELDLCYANPYIKKVYDILLDMGKTIIITSDMYLGSQRLKQLVESCGYSGYTELYCSCDSRKSKYDGSIWQTIKQQFGENIAHIGDNQLSDIKKAQENKIAAFYYPNVNHMGAMHRAEMAPVIGSFYAGIVNAHLHNGLNRFSVQYEYGFTYGGILAVGFARYLHELKISKNADTVMFFSRDGYILQRVYNLMYPEDKTVYAYWGRSPAAKLSFEYYKADYFRRFIYHKRSGGLTLKQVLDCMELDCKAFGLDENERLSTANADKVVSALCEHSDIISAAYEPGVKAAREYYRKLLCDSSIAIAADCGWAGSGYIVLQRLFKQWDIDTVLYGAVAGYNSKYQPDSDYSALYLRQKKLYAYCFSDNFNSELYQNHLPGAGHNIYFELMFGAPHPGCTGFAFDGEKAVPVTDSAPESAETYAVINEIHNGIMDFARCIIARSGKYDYLLDISGQDAYAPFALAVQSKKYPMLVLGECDFSTDVNGKKEKLKEDKT